MVDQGSFMEFVSERIDELNIDLYKHINKPIHDNPETIFDVSPITQSQQRHN